MSQPSLWVCERSIALGIKTAPLRGFCRRIVLRHSWSKFSFMHGLLRPTRQNASGC